MIALCSECDECIVELTLELIVCLFQTVTVFQGQIARLPCSGMPDVIPGPPEIWFEKEGSDRPLGLHGYFY